MTHLSQSSTIQQNSPGRKVNELSMLIEVITEISEQTHLLAINAGIEAERAGDTGKRFALLANEIKQLASRTILATTEIKNAIGSFTNSTEQSVGEIAKIPEPKHSQAEDDQNEIHTASGRNNKSL